MPTKPCEPNCVCGLHNRTKMHNTLIGMSVSRTAEAKGYSTSPKAIWMRNRNKR